MLASVFLSLIVGYGGSLPAASTLHIWNKIEFRTRAKWGSCEVKNYLIGGLVCLLVALVYGVEPVQRVINEATHKGTLKGIETCMEYSSSRLLSEAAIKETCIRAFQKRLYHKDHATGRAGPRLNQRIISWGGILENKTSDHVTTWIRVSVSIFDAEGTEQEHFAETPIWIDPLDEAEFIVDLPDFEHKQFKDIEFCDHDELEPKACMNWGVVAVRGVEI